MKFMMLFSVVAVAILGCKKASDSGDPVDPAGNNFTITVAMPSEAASIVTRAVDAASEIAINSAYVVIYADDAAATLPKFTTVVAKENITDVEGVTNSKVLSFIKDNSVVAGDKVHIIFNKELSDLNVAQGILIEALKLTSAGIGTGPFSNGLVDVSKGLPMYGKGVWVDGATNISVRRSVAKVQLKLVYGTGLNHVAGKFGKGYTTANTTFKLYQLSDAGYIDGSELATTGSETVSVADDNDITHQSALMADNFTGANYIFAYPYAQRTIGAAPASLKGDNTPKTERLAMIMKNTFDGKTVYHRLDICEPSTKIYYDIVNNHHYSIRLREVSGDGYDSATTALINPPSNVQYNVVVENEGDVVVTNGQYVLNIDTKEDSFDVAGADSKIVLAKVNRVESDDAKIPAETEFKTVLNGLSVSTGSKALTFALSGVPATLGKDVKSLDLAVSGAEDGMGMAKFRYIAKLGSIVYRSTPITLNSNFGVVEVSNLGEALTFKVSSSSAEWSVSSDASWANPIKSSTGFSLDISSFISGSRKAKIIVSNPSEYNNQAGESIVINVEQVAHVIWADRNVGVDYSDVDETDSAALEAALKDHNRSRYHYYTWTNAPAACANWVHNGRSDWRLPTKKDLDVLLSYKMVYNVTYGTVTTAMSGDVYFPMSGYSGADNSIAGCYWTSDVDGVYDRGLGYHFYLGYGSNVIGYWSTDKHYGASIRCIAQPLVKL